MPTIKTHPLLVTILAVFFFIGNAMAVEFKDLTAQEVKAKLDSGEKFLLLNPLSDIEFNEGHIPGSVNIPFHLLQKSDQLPADKSFPVVSYCLGPECIFYKKAAATLAEMGYTNIMTFKGGIPEWAKAGFDLDVSKALEKKTIPTINVDQLKSKLGSVVILDIRAPSLYEMGWLAGSTKIPLAELSGSYTDIPKDKPIVVVDHAGKQVLPAARFLSSKGYAQIERLEGGLMAWNAKGYPLDK